MAKKPKITKRRAEIIEDGGKTVHVAPAPKPMPFFPQPKQSQKAILRQIARRPQGR